MLLRQGVIQPLRKPVTVGRVSLSQVVCFLGATNTSWESTMCLACRTSVAGESGA